MVLATVQRKMVPSILKTKWEAGRSLVRKSLDTGVRMPESSAHARLPLPHTFKPRLSFVDACIAVAQALARIFSGSLLFGVCGTYTWIALENVRNPLLKAAILVPAIVIFLILLGLLMAAISFFIRFLFPHRIQS